MMMDRPARKNAANGQKAAALKPPAGKQGTPQCLLLCNEYQAGETDVNARITGRMLSVIQSLRPARRSWLLAAALLSAWLLSATAAQAERPPLIRLIPKDTLALVTVPDTQQLFDRFNQTNFGRMMQDPQVRPLVKQLYDGLRAELGGVEERLGVTLDELLKLPQGELCLALAPSPEGSLALIALIEVKDQHHTAKKLLDKVSLELANQGVEFGEETVGGTHITYYQLRRRQFAYFDRDGALVLSTNLEALKYMLAAWESGLDEPLADNRAFAAVREKCRGLKDEPPQFFWYADPIGLTKALVPREGANAFLLALLQPLGLEGIRAVGGSLTMSTERFDAVAQAYLLLQEPREGILNLPTFISGDTKPESWVPDDAAGYTTINFDFAQTYDKVQRLVDRFTAEGTTAAQVQQSFDGLGINFESEFLDLLDNRVTIVGWMKKPSIVLNDSAQILGLRLKDPAKAKPVIEKVAERFSDRIEKDNYAGVVYYRIKANRRPRVQAQRDDNQRPMPAFALIGNHLVLSTHHAAIERAIIASRDTSHSLAEAIDFKLIVSQAENMVGEGQLCLFSFGRPEEGFRMMYDLATNKGNREALQRRAENNRGLRVMHQALQANPLPPFESLRKYLAPGGAVLVDDGAGLHYISFNLRRE